MEGRTIARPNCGRDGHVLIEPVASMEGRTIARPNMQTTVVACVQVVASMEGRTIARPNGDHAGEGDGAPFASMEGRTIARPNAVGWALTTAPVSRLQWRAGQLPGQTSKPVPSCRAVTTLQWRAGQLPGQTSFRARRRDAALPASMEGRTIARPNRGRGRCR